MDGPPSGGSRGASAFEALIEVMKTLTFEERKKVYTYSRDVAERCAGKQELKSQETGWKSGLPAI